MTNTPSIRCSWASLLTLAAVASLNACGGLSLDVGSNDHENKLSSGGTGGDATAAGGAGLAAAGTSAKAGDGNVGGSEPEVVECPCSRRPAANNSFQCAMGVDETTSQDLGPEGGLAEIHGQQGAASGVSFALSIPPNALPEEVTVQLTETSAPPPSDLIDYSPVYLVEPTDVTARFPMKLTVPFGSNSGFANLAVYVADTVDGPFEPLSDSYTNAGFMQASTTRFGAFVVGGPRTAAEAGCP